MAPYRSLTPVSTPRPIPLHAPSQPAEGLTREDYDKLMRLLGTVVSHLLELERKLDGVLLGHDLEAS